MAEIRAQRGRVLVRALFWDADGWLLAVPSHDGDSKLVLWFLLIRTLIPFMRALPSPSNYLPKDLPTNTITLGLRVQDMYLGGAQTFNPLQPVKWGWQQWASDSIKVRWNISIYFKHIALHISILRPVSKYLFATYCVWGTVLGAGDTGVNKTHPYPDGAHSG